MAFKGRLPSSSKKEAKVRPNVTKIKKMIKYATVSVLAMSLLGVSVWDNMPGSDDPTNNNTDTTNIGLEYGFPNWESKVPCTVSECCIQCEAMNFENSKDVEWLHILLDQIRPQKSVGICTSDRELILDNSKFVNGSLNDKWLSNPYINRLSLINSVFEIGPNSFAGFPAMNRLQIRSTGLTHLTKTAFANMNDLTDLELSDNWQMSWVENGFLHQFKQLNTLQIVGSEISDGSDGSIAFFSNLTGNQTYKSLSSVDFRFNGIKTVTKSMFDQLPSLSQIFLESNEIVQFEAGAFDNNKYVKLFHLDSNRIEELDQGTFEDIFKKATVSINGNKLRCDCKLKWLQDYALGHSISKRSYGDDWQPNPTADLNSVSDFQNLLCQYPKKNQNKTLLEADMSCDDEPPDSEATTTKPATTIHTETPTTTAEASSTIKASSTATETLPPTIETTSTENPNNEVVPTETGTESTDTTIYDNATGLPPDDGEVEVTCTIVGESRLTRSIGRESFRIKREDRPILKLGSKQLHFAISEDESRNVKVSFQDQGETRTVLWLTNHEAEGRERKIEPPGCSTGISTNTYVIKDLKPETSYLFCAFIENNINLLDCLAYTTLPLEQDQTWINFGAKPTAIAILVIVTLAAFAIGGAILYFLVRKNPVLIRGSKSVIVVKRQKKQQVIVLPKGYKEVSSETTSNSSERKPSLEDTYSVVSYISAIQPTPMEILNYKLERLRAKNQEESDSKWQNPPLPPPPSYPGNERSTITSDMLYYDYM